MYKHMLAAATVAGFVLSGCGFGYAADSTKVDSVAADVTENGCVVSSLAASRVVQVQNNAKNQYVQLQWSSVDNCTGQQLTAGFGQAPVTVMNGTWASGELYLNVDSSTLQNFSKAGQDVIIGLIFTKAQDWENTSTGTTASVVRVPAPTKTTRTSTKRIEAPATLQGATTFADFRPGTARMSRSEDTAR